VLFSNPKNWSYMDSKKHGVVVYIINNIFMT
jgi:hypothetical protein